VEAYLAEDYAEALRLARIGSKTRDPLAITILGLLYMNGKGVEQDIKKGARFMLLAASRGSVDAQYHLATYYDNGVGVVQDSRRAAFWYGEAFSQAKMHDYYRAAKIQVLNQGGYTADDIKLHKLQKKMLELGSAHAALVVAIFQAGGTDGHEADPAKVAELVARAAALGDTDASFLLGIYYVGGFGVSKDLDRAMSLFHQLGNNSLDRGETADAREILDLMQGFDPEHPQTQALSRLLDAYASGKVSPSMVPPLTEVTAATSAAQSGELAIDAYNNRDYPAALRLARIGSKTKDPLAMMILGILYEEGAGVEQNPERGVRWVRLAALKKYYSAQFYMGTYYENGIGVEQDFKKALFWYSEAVSQGSREAMYRVAVFQEKGLEGVTADDTKAAELYQLALEFGSAEAAHMLSIYRRDGRGGLEVDPAKSAELMARAATQGIPEANYFLATFYEREYGVSLDLERALSLFHNAGKGFLDQGKAAETRKMLDLMQGRSPDHPQTQALKRLLDAQTSPESVSD
jgi:TPR repeat protein